MQCDIGERFSNNNINSFEIVLEVSRVDVETPPKTADVNFFVSDWFPNSALFTSIYTFAYEVIVFCLLAHAQ